METSLIGRAKELEVAGLLIRNGIYVFLPLVDSGADLLVANRAASVVIPVQVKYRANALNLDLNEATDFPRFGQANTVIAFVIGAIKQRTWFIPFSDWRSKSVNNKRKDRKVFVPIRKNEEWLKKYEGDEGVRHSFQQLLQ